MPLRKKHSANRRPAKAAKASPRRRSKTQALAVADAVRREPVAALRLANPLAAFAPLQRTVIDRQLALLSAAMAWSPAHIIMRQQAAFWDGFMGSSEKAAAKRRAVRKRAKVK